MEARKLAGEREERERGREREREREGSCVQILEPLSLILSPFLPSHWNCSDGQGTLRLNGRA